MIKRMLIRISVFALAALVGMMVVPVRWDCGGIVHGTLFDGRGGFTYTSCTSSDSSLLTYGHEGYVTAAKAHQVFEQRVREAVTVIERNEKLDANGNKIGERAVTIRFNPERNRNYASVFWVDERIVSFVDSTSLKYALQHEGVLDR